VGEDFHEIQFWELPDEPIQYDHTTLNVYNWLTARMNGRGGLPAGMPEFFEGLSVTATRNGREGRILFTHINSYHNSLRDQPVKVEVSYRWGYTRIGMGDRYTLMMLANELWVLTHNKWDVYPKQPHQTRADGTICHETFEK
jgi:hypothetical protein